MLLANVSNSGELTGIGEELINNFDQETQLLRGVTKFPTPLITTTIILYIYN